MKHRAPQLKAIAPEVDRLLGPAEPVTDVLAALDRQYKVGNKPAVYFLEPDQPIAPHLNDLLKPNTDFLNAAARRAYRNGAHADAVTLYDEYFKLLAADPIKAQTTRTQRLSRTIALRELGGVQPARDELRGLLSLVESDDSTPAFIKGRVHQHLAICEWRLGDREVALREAKESLKAFSDDPVFAADKKQTEQLVADLKANKPLPPLAKVDVVAALENARVRFRARAALATLPLNQSAVPLLDQVLGPTKSPQEVFETLDRQYREQNKSAIWFLPLSQPIAPHLDELLGPLPAKVKE